MRCSATDLGFTRDRHSKSPKSAIADLGGRASKGDSQGLKESGRSSFEARGGYHRGAPRADPLARKDDGAMQQSAFNSSWGIMTMKSIQRFAVVVWAAAATLAASPVFAQPAQQASKIDGADTAWMIAATGMVLMMTIPGLALFYAGMVRKKNVLATMAQSLAATFLVSILWAFLGYSLAFTGDGAFIGTLERIFLRGMALDTVSPLAKTIPE